MRLKRWESPRRSGRNNKGSGGSARQRQLKKQTQMLRKRLKAEIKEEQGQEKRKGKRKMVLFPFYFQALLVLGAEKKAVNKGIMKKC